MTYVIKKNSWLWANELEHADTQYLWTALSYLANEERKMNWLATKPNTI